MKKILFDILYACLFNDTNYPEVLYQLKSYPCSHKFGSCQDLFIGFMFNCFLLFSQTQLSSSFPIPNLKYSVLHVFVCKFREKCANAHELKAFPRRQLL